MPVGSVFVIVGKKKKKLATIFVAAAQPSVGLVEQKTDGIRQSTPMTLNDFLSGLKLSPIMP